MTTCCHLHRPGFVDSHDGDALCCDPNDCSPCCENCPTCPTLARDRLGRALPK